MSTLDRWYASGPIGVNTDFAEFGTAASTMGSALRHDDWDTLNLLDGRTAAGDQGPNLNLWGMSETQEAIRLATISARSAPTSTGGVSSYLTFHAKGPESDVTEMLRINGGDREQDRVVRFTAPSTVIVGAGGDGILKTRRINGKRWDNDEPEGLYLNHDTGTPVQIGGGLPSRLDMHGDITMHGTCTLQTTGRMHLSGDDALLLHRNGAFISRAWGGTGNLTVEGSIHVPEGDIHVIRGDINVHRYTRTWDCLARGGVYIGDEGAPAVDIQRSGNIRCHDVFARGGVYVGGDGQDLHTAPARMNANGTIVGKKKNFVIDHPLRPDEQHLVHGAIEGPETGVYYRGEATTGSDGCAEVALPNYFETLVRPVNRTVQVTPLIGERLNVSPLGVSEVRDGRFTVRTLDGVQRSQKFYWEVKGVRMDVEELEVEIDKTDAHTVECAPVNA